MDTRRRNFLTHSLTTGAVMLAVASGLLIPRRILAAWPKEAFDATDASTALKMLLGEGQPDTNKNILLKTTTSMSVSGPEVTVVVSTSIPEIDSIALIVPVNKKPLAAAFQLGAGTKGFIKTRIKMDASGELKVVVKAKDRLYSVSQSMDLSGCGCS